MSARGFTLLEIMVVLVLIGIITSFALLSVGGGGPHERLAEEVRRLAALIELHQQEAILNGETHGIQFSRAGYALLTLGEKGQWQSPTAANTLVQQTLPEDIALSLWVEGRAVDLKTTGKLPQVLLLASGETTEFVAVFGLADDPSPDAPRYRVAGDALGRLTMAEVAR